MVALIHLTTPVPASIDAQGLPTSARLAISVGRALSASNFQLQSQYVDTRLQGLSTGASGVISGLGVTPASYANLGGGGPATSFVIAPGSGIGADGRLVRLTAPLVFSWSALLASLAPGTTIADGFHFLTLSTVQFDGLNGPPPDAAADAGEDPLLDIRQDSFVELSLSASIPSASQPLTSNSVTGPMTLDAVTLAVNTLIGGLSPASLATAMGNGVPVALVLAGGNQLLWLSQAAGRVIASDNPPAALLLAQTREALAAALKGLGPNAPAASWTPIAKNFRYLPGGCELPLGILAAPASFAPAPTCPFLPGNISVYLQAIPASQSSNLLTRALSRPAIDLQDEGAPAVTLVLAVPDANWTPTLLAIPSGDPMLPADLHFAYAFASAAQSTLQTDWIDLYGGMNHTPAAWPQAIAFLIDADAAALNLGYLLRIGGIQIADLLSASAAAPTSPDSFLQAVNNWLGQLEFIASLSSAPTGATPAPTPMAQAASAAVGAATAARAAVASAGSAPTASALNAQLTTSLAAWPKGEAAAVAAVNASATIPLTSVLMNAASAAAALAALPSTPSAANSAIATAVCAAAATAATAAILTGASTTVAQTAAATAAMTLPAAIPPVPSSASATLQLLANAGYQILASDPDPSAVPTPSDNFLGATPQDYPPSNWNFAAWKTAVTSTSPNPALLQPFINAGIISATQASPANAITTFLTPSLAVVDPAVSTTPGALLQLAATQLFYAVMARVARAQEYSLEGHSRLIALQRQHVDMMSTYVSALAGGVPSDGSGLAITRIIPYFNLTSDVASTTTTPAATQAIDRSRMLTEKRAVPPTSAQASPAISAAVGSSVAMKATVATSAVATASIAKNILAAPVMSKVSDLFGNQTDIAKSVATDIGAVTQAPQFSFAPVPYGTAAHITPASTLFQTATNGLVGLRGLMGRGPIGVSPTTAVPTVTPAATDTATLEASFSDGVLQTMRSLLGDIAEVETNAMRVEAGYLMLRDRLQAMETLISQLTGAVASARDALRAAPTAAARAEGDYVAARSLVAEEAARVAALWQNRSAAIASATGLFMVRQLLTPIARPPQTALTLIADTPQDLAPGCLSDHPGPPASLTPFLNLLLETPLSSWMGLVGGWVNLPDNAGLQRLSGLRAVRLNNFTLSTDFGSGAAAADLAALATNGRAVMDPALRQSFTLGPSLAVNQQAAFSVFSLPDLMTLPANPLRTDAETLRSRMEDATGCLYQTLLSLPPSSRFAWATLARAGTLPTLNFVQWPLPAGASDAVNAAIRQLSTLVTWMAGQIVDGASAATQTALGNLVGAAVIASAYGDPDETVTGPVVSTGGAPRTGWPIRVTLNRPPPIGTLLNVLDANQNIVGTARIEDHDSFGSSATIVSTLTSVAAGANLTVASPRGRSPWLAS